MSRLRIADVLGFKMKLCEAEFVDYQLLYQPHLYDPLETGFLKSMLKPGDMFLDIGAYIGFYSLLAYAAVGDGGKVLAVEADPYNYSILCVILQAEGLWSEKNRKEITNHRSVLCCRCTTRKMSILLNV
ncbi:MAG: hypothetical protein KGZ79_09115 [Dethiobacter sp.]|nr:hypothetical protein [Dethiobacter sp.]